MKNVYLLFGAKGDLLHVCSSMKVAERVQRGFKDTYIRKCPVISPLDF